MTNTSQSSRKPIFALLIGALIVAAVLAMASSFLGGPKEPEWRYAEKADDLTGETITSAYANIEGEGGSLHLAIMCQKGEGSELGFNATIAPAQAMREPNEIVSILANIEGKAVQVDMGDHPQGIYGAPLDDAFGDAALSANLIKLRVKAQLGRVEPSVFETEIDMNEQSIRQVIGDCTSA